METAGNPPALADAADVLSAQLRAHLKQLARLLRPHASSLERRFLARLRRRGFDGKRRKALAAITPFAAAGVLAGRRPPEVFFEQVEYNGRRLAKLGLSPGEIVQALRDSDDLVSPVFLPLSGRERADLQWVLEQLHFCVVLTLNNAFYQVRESETEAYQELFQAELESASLGELLPRMLAILCRFCNAGAGALFLFDDRTSEWTREAYVEGGMETPAELRVPSSRTRLRELAEARCTTARSKTQKLVLDRRWATVFSSCWSVPLSLRGRVAGVMQFGFTNTYDWLPRELALLTAAAERCLMAAEKARLAGQLAAREAQVRGLASRMMQVEERERRRISSELHDEAGQSLLCLRLHLELLERTATGLSPALREGLAEARALTERTITEIRRLIGDLSPAVLEQLGLPAALRQLAARLRRLTRIAVKVRIAHLGRLPLDLERVAYRIIQECLNNIVRHAAASTVNISVTTADGKLKLGVEDNGVGFDVEVALGKRDSFGLAGMRERVALFSGEFQLRSRPGHGTKILIELPVPVGAQP